MLSPTDRKNINKLKELRQYKMNKVILDIRKSKKALNEIYEEKELLETELWSFKSERMKKHDALFKELQEKKLSTIEDFRKHQVNNQQLIFDEEDISQNIIETEKRIAQKEEEVKKYESLLKNLNKKIESLKELKSSL